MTQTDERAAVAAAMTAAGDARALAAALDNSLKAASLAWEYEYTVTGAIVVNVALTPQRFIAPAAKAELGDLVLIYPTARQKIGSVTLGSFFFRRLASLMRRARWM